MLIANQPNGPQALIGQLGETLGHSVIEPWPEDDDIHAVITRTTPDVALVTIGDDAGPALALIERIVLEATCPVVALLDSPNPELLLEASKRGVFGYIINVDGDSYDSVIDIVWRRFSEFRRLQGAFGRRAVIERAKGILMERHSIDESTAFGLLRKHSRTTNQRLIDVSRGVAAGHALLPGPRVLGPPERLPPRVPSVR